jgi:hypothetical protein
MSKAQTSKGTRTNFDQTTEKLLLYMFHAGTLAEQEAMWIEAFHLMGESDRDLLYRMIIALKRAQANQQQAK